MKNAKTIRLIAAVIVVFQLVALLAIGASAANMTADIYRVDPSTMTLDGQISYGEPWAELETHKQAFVDTDANAITDSIRVMWGSDNGGAYIYYYIVYTDSDGVQSVVEGPNSSWQKDGFLFGVDEKGAFAVEGDPTSANVDAHRCGTQEAVEGKRTSGAWLEYCVKRDGTLVIIEAKTTFVSDVEIDVGSIVGLNVMVQACDGASMQQIAWNGSNPNVGTTNYVKCTLNEKYAADVNVNYNENDNAVFYNNGKAIMSKNAEGGNIILPQTISGVTVAGWKNRADNKLYAPSASVAYADGDEQLEYDAVVASPSMRGGAAVYIENPSKLGFTVTVNGFENSKDYISKMGVLTCEATLLTDAMIEAGLTKETLTQNGITPTDSVADAPAESYRAEISVTQNDTQYAAIGYLTVKYSDNTEKTFYTSFSKTANVRSVQEVAAAAYNDRTGVKVDGYQFKQRSEYAVLNFEKLSYSPYANVQLKILKVLGNVA